MCALSRKGFHYPLTGVLKKLAEILMESEVESLLDSSFKDRKQCFTGFFVIINAKAV